jgi:hypothetical protein
MPMAATVSAAMLLFFSGGDDKETLIGCYCALHNKPRHLETQGK